MTFTIVWKEGFRAVSPCRHHERQRLFMFMTGYCNAGSVRKGVGVWLRSRSLIGAWQTMQDR